MNKHYIAAVVKRKEIEKRLFAQGNQDAMQRRQPRIPDSEHYMDGYTTGKIRRSLRQSY